MDTNCLDHQKLIAQAKEVFSVEIEGLKCTCDSIDVTFVSAIEMMLAAQREGGIVVVTGVGKNLHIAEKMSAIFSSTGTRSIVLNPVQAMHGDLGMVCPKDVLIALSFSGESDEVNRLIPAVRRHGLKVISMTRNPNSTLARLSDVHIEIPCGKEACPFGMVPTNSTTATMAMGDALAMVMIDCQQFKIEDYALNHPAGAIGRALVMKVSDIMRTGDRLAKVSPEATIMDALLAMTRCKAGAAVVADKAGKLLGIFTDGDFRRVMSEKADGSVLKDLITMHMTKSPMFVHNDVYAADLLRIFEKRHIDDLPVCDDSGHIVGIVDIQDLPKMKVL